MSRRVSSLDKTTVGIERNISSQYDNVKTVADNIESVITTADSTASIAIVSGIADKVSTLAVISDALSSLYADKAVLDSLFADKATLDSLFADKAALNSLYADKETLDSIFADKTTLDSLFADKVTLDRLYTSVTNIDRVFSSIDNLDRVFTSITNLDRLFTSIDKLDAVYAAIANIDIVADNIVDIQNAEENATLAHKWAQEAEDVEVTPGEYSAYHWAQKSEEYVANPSYESVTLLGGTGDQGKVSWNTDEETLDLIQNGATLQLGQEVQYHVRNASGALIANGTPVMAIGALGASGRIKVAPMDATTHSNTKYYLGIATEDIENDTDGKVSWFGKIRGIDTSGGLSYGGLETWNNEDLLYPDPDHAGYLTNVEPTLYNVSYMPVAIVINAHASAGTLFCRTNNINRNAYRTPILVAENSNSAGRLFGGEVSDAGGGAVNITAGAGIIKTGGTTIDGDTGIPADINEGQGSTTEIVQWDAQTGVPLAGVGYNLIYWDASAGAFAVVLKEDFYSVFNFVTDFTVGRVYYDGTTVTTRLCGMNHWNFDRRVQMFGEERFPVERASGLLLGEIGERYLTVSAGTIWAELVNRFSIAAIDTSGADTFTAWYRDGVGGWVETAGSQVDNLNYDGGTGALDALTPQKYGVHWAYVAHDGRLHLVYGQGSYTLSDANIAEIPATLPGLVGAYGTLVGKIIVQKSGTNLFSVQTSFNTSFSSAAVSEHNDLSSLQGGSVGEYYHLTSVEVDKLTGIEAGAEVNNISDLNAADLTDAGDSALHYHSTDRARANHTGTQLASTISDFATAVQNEETVTSLSINANILSFFDEDGLETQIDLSLYLDDTNLARLVSGTLDGGTGIATFTRDDATTFTVDFSALLDDTQVTVTDNLTSTATDEALSANQGRVLTLQDSYMTEADFMALAAANRDKFAGSGEIESGNVYVSTANAINEGLWAYPTTANVLYWGTELSPVGVSKSNVPILDINGFRQKIDGVSYTDAASRNAIKFPPAPIATNLVTNGTFDTDTSGWTAVNNSTVTIIDGAVKIQNDGSNYGLLYQQVTLEVGKTYLVEVEVVEYSAGYARCGISTFVPTLSPQTVNVQAAGRYSFEFTPTQSVNYLSIGNRNDFDAYNVFDNISIIDLGKVERQDLVFLESWHEKIADKNIVYPYGNTQSLLATDPSTSLTTGNGSFTGYGTYSLFGNWQSTNALIGKGLVWSTMSDANKKKFVSNPENNVYLAEDGELVQVRYRIRVVEGLGADWENIDTQSDVGLQATTGMFVIPKGRSATIDYELGSPVVAQGNYYSPVNIGDSYIVQSTKNDGAFGIRTYSSNLAYKSLCFALPIALVSRRNQGAYHPVFNPNGARLLLRSNRYDGILNGARTWYEYTNPVTMTSPGGMIPRFVADCFTVGESGASATDEVYAYENSGHIGSIGSGRPDGKFYDAIYEGDVLDLRNSSHKQDLTRTLEREFNKLVAGETRGWEGSVFTKTESVYTYTSANPGTTLALYTDSREGSLVSLGYYSSEAEAKNDLAVTGRTIYLAYSGIVYALTYNWSETGYVLFTVSPSIDRGGTEGVILDCILLGLRSKRGSAIPSKEPLHCDIIGNPANYYRGQTYTNTGSSQTVTVTQNKSVIWNRDGNSTNGLDGHFYLFVGVTGSADLSVVDYTSANWTDLGTNWNGAGSWLTIGIAGTSLLVGESGEDLIPDGTAKNQKFTRKANSAPVLVLYSTNNGNSWSDVTNSWITAFFDATDNGFVPISIVTGAIVLIFYLTEASPFETADNAEVLEYSDLIALHRYLTGEGSGVVSHLIGKVPTSNVAPYTPRLPLQNYHLYLGKFGADNYPTHTGISIGSYSAPAAKVLPYLTRENGKLFLQTLFKEMKYDSGADTAAEFTTIDPTVAQTYVAGTYYLFGSGIWAGTAFKCIAAITTIADAGAFHETPDGDLIRTTTGVMYFKRWDGNGWGDDGRFSVVDDVSTTIDDNANTVLIGQKRIELPYFIGDGE